MGSRFAFLGSLLQQHGGNAEEFGKWEKAVRLDPELIRPSDDELRTYGENATAVEESIRAQPHSGNGEQLKRVKAAKRKAEKLAWLYE